MKLLQLESLLVNCYIKAVILPGHMVNSWRMTEHMIYFVWPYAGINAQVGMY